MCTKFYIADTHFGHEKVLDFCQRPFQTIHEMDAMIIENWNRVVSKEDDVYVIGDFMFRSAQTPEYYLEKLNGKLHLIRGNHERWTNRVDVKRYFESDNMIIEITDSNSHLVLCHYPIAEWPRYYRGSLHIFGHIHNTREGAAYEYYLKQPCMFNAGVDINQFMPVTLEQLIENNRRFKNNQNK